MNVFYTGHVPKTFIDCLINQKKRLARRKIGYLMNKMSRYYSLMQLLCLLESIHSCSAFFLKHPHE